MISVTVEVITPEQADTIRAVADFLNGKTIEKWREFSNRWEPYTGTPKEMGKYRPVPRMLPTDPAPRVMTWSKPGDVPGPVCWLRHKELSLEAIILNVSEKGFEWITNTCKFCTWESFAKSADQYEHSTDRKTWLPCVEVVR